jgi:hypothetical protein
MFPDLPCRGELLVLVSFLRNGTERNGIQSGHMPLCLRYNTLPLFHFILELLAVNLSALYFSFNESTVTNSLHVIHYI